LSESTLPYALRRVHQDGTEELVSEHPDFANGYRRGTYLVTTEDKEGAYSLYRGSERVAKFGHSRLMVPRSTASVQSGLDLMV